MKIIALTGNASSGKSQTMNTLYSLLLAKAFIQKHGYFRTLGNATQNDFLDLLEVSGTLVGIFTMGDYERGNSSVIRLINELLTNECEYIFCACNLQKSKAIKYLQSMNATMFNKTVVYDPSKYRIENYKDAYKMLNELIGK